MHVAHVRVCVDHLLVMMHVRMRLEHRPVVVVQMMVIVHMDMVVIHGLVPVGVVMSLTQHDEDTEAHEQAGQELLRAERLG